MDEEKGIFEGVYRKDGSERKCGCVDVVLVMEFESDLEKGI